MSSQSSHAEIIITEHTSRSHITKNPDPSVGSRSKCGLTSSLWSTARASKPEALGPTLVAKSIFLDKSSLATKKCGKGKNVDELKPINTLSHFNSLISWQRKVSPDDVHDKLIWNEAEERGDWSGVTPEWPHQNQSSHQNMITVLALSPPSG